MIGDPTALPHIAKPEKIDRLTHPSFKPNPIDSQSSPPKGQRCFAAFTFKVASAVCGLATPLRESAR